ncbi:MAG: arginine kinase [Pseudomonadota bacterium]
MDLPARIAALRPRQPQNLALKHFDAAWFAGLSHDEQRAFNLRIRSGIENPDSEMGCYALAAEDYNRFAPFFDRVIADHHGINLARVQRGISSPENLEHNGSSDTLGTLSKRIRIGRNLADLPLPGGMDRTQRVALENDVATAVKEMPEHFQHFSLTPNHAKAIDKDTYGRLIGEHLFFKPMDTDPYLAAAGIAGDWPHGRAAFVSADKATLLWVNEEDHLRLMVMDKTLPLGALLERLMALEAALKTALGTPFATNERLGFITSCPTNIGTALRASIHVPLPRLIAREGLAGLKGRAAAFGLAVRGLGGEHTGAGADGMVDLSPRARLGVSAPQIIGSLQTGVAQLLAEERAA